MTTREHSRSRHFNIMLIVLAVAGLGAAFVAIDPLARASQGTHHGWTGHRGDGVVAAAVCAGSRDDRVKELGAYLGSALDLDAAQKEAWHQVEQELEQGMALLRDACAKFASNAAPATMPQRLAVMESAMAAGTETLRAVRPTFEAFYGTLDEEQRHKIDEMSRHRGSEVR